MAIDPALVQTFWQLFEAGQHAQAEQLSMRLAEMDPQVAEPHYLRGSLYQVLGHAAQASECYRQALLRDPAHVSALNNLGVLLTQEKKLDLAVGLLRERVRLAPDQHDGYCNLANALAQLGRLEDAYACYQKAIELKPDFAEAMTNLGSHLLFNGQLERAIAWLSRAVSLVPNSWEARVNYGQALLRSRQQDAAIEQFQIADKLHPEDPGILTNLGFAHLEKGDLGRAAEVLRDCASKHPEYMPVYKQLGILCFHLQKYENASVFFRHFLSRHPEHAEAHQNLGFVYTMMGRYADAIVHLREATRLDPMLMEAHNSIGILYGRQGMDVESLAAFDTALQLKPDHWSLHSNRAMILLRQERFEEGWPEYELRLKTLPPSPSPKPQWQGENLAGKTILLTWEQGLGDTIHFIRYAPLLKERGARVIAVVQKSILPLLSRMSGVDEWVASGSESLPEHDYQSPLASLPYRLGTLNAPVPYLSADPALVAKWRDEIIKLPGKRIGIGWQGDPGFLGDKHRSVPLRCFAPIAAIPGVTLVSLQRYVGLDQIAPNAAAVPLIDLGPHLDNEAGAFMDSAAVMQHLDLVITSDTALAHLAGALGVPVWLAVSFAPDWRWFQGTETSVWYPSMRMFRQTRLDAWEEVFERMRLQMRG